MAAIVRLPLCRIYRTAPDLCLQRGTRYLPIGLPLASPRFTAHPVQGVKQREGRLEEQYKAEQAKLGRVGAALEQFFHFYAATLEASFQLAPGPAMAPASPTALLLIVFLFPPFFVPSLPRRSPRLGPWLRPSRTWPTARTCA